MTLQIQTLFVLPLLMTTSVTSWSPDPDRGRKTAVHYAITHTDSTLPYFSRLVLQLPDSLQRPADAQLQRPQIKMNKNAGRFVEAFIKKNRKDLEEIDSRSKTLFPVMEKIFEKHGLPVQLKYLAVVESDLKVKALSHAGAVGYWQLMKETASELGLNVSGKTDERRNLRKSTAAAAKYLKALYRQYDDWLLVIAAYNTGPGIVNKAIKNAGSRNFWQLQAHLPAETRGHVKRFIAVHYYFENSGSETTVTKTERLAYAKAVEGFHQQVKEHTKLTDSTGCF